MSAPQADLFAVSSRAEANDEIVTIVRAQLRSTLELVKAAETMPWTDQLDIIRADNTFRYCKDVLPPAEAAELWEAFNREMDRLYAVLREGAEPEHGD